jgi:hypothetical protein
MTVAVLNVEVAVTLRLIADFPCNLHAVGLELVAQRIGTLNPNIRA